MPEHMRYPSIAGLFVRPFEPRGQDATDVERISYLCHPTRSMRPDWWWHALPTLVAVLAAHDTPRPYQIIGYTQFSLAPNMIFFYDLAVHPSEQRRGIGSLLMRARLLAGRAWGAKHALGMTPPGNVAMRAMAAKWHFLEGDLIEDHYEDQDPMQDGIPLIATPETWRMLDD